MDRKVASFAAVALFLSGCASMTTHTMNDIIGSWQGEPVSKVVAQWGEPTQKVVGIDITMYQWTDSQHEGLISLKTERNTDAPPSGLIKGTCTRQLVVENASNTVQRGNFHGDNCCVAAVSGYCKSLKNPRHS